MENKKLFKHHIFSTYTWFLGSHELSEQDSFWLAGVFSYALVMSKIGTCILSLYRGYYDPLIVSFNLRQSFDPSYQFFMWRYLCRKPCSPSASLKVVTRSTHLSKNLPPTGIELTSFQNTVSKEASRCCIEECLLLPVIDRG